MQSAYMQGQVGEFWAVGVFLWEKPERVSARGGMVPRALHERQGWQEDRQAKRLVDDSLMQKPALEEVSNESRGGWLGDLSPTKQSQGLKEEWSADGAWLPQ